MSSPRALVLGDFVGVARDSGDFRAVTGWAGWDDSPGIRTSFEPRAQQDGAWDATGFLDARVVGLEGYVERGTHADATATRDELAALRSKGLLELVVDDGTDVRSALVRVSQGAVFTWLNDVTFKYTIQVTAPDPLKYGPQTVLSTGLSGAGGTGRVWARAWPRDWGVPPGTTPGAVSVPNAGTVAYWPRLRIDGPVPNPVVTLNETGDWLRVDITLTAGQWLDIDLGNRRVLLNGTLSVMSKVTFSGRWLAVPVGGGSLSWSADSADPDAILTCVAVEGAFQ